MDTGTFQCVPRVELNDLKSQSHPTENWELASEKLTLSMCRYNACVLGLPGKSAKSLDECFLGLEGLLQLSKPGLDVKDYTALKATGDEEPGLVTLPGRHSFNYKLGSSRCNLLQEQQFTHLQHVRPLNPIISSFTLSC